MMDTKIKSKEEIMECCLQSLKAVSNLFDESIYVVDLKNRNFIFVSEKGIFLNDHSPEEIIAAGFSFFKDVIHDADYPLAMKIYQEVEHYFSNDDTFLRDLDYVKFNFRIRSKRGLLMTKHVITPLSLNNQMHVAVCAVSYSMDKTPGNFYAFYKNRDVYYRYSLEGDRWVREQLIRLNHRETTILEMAKAGIKTKDIADHLCISKNTMRNALAAIYQKLDIHSINEAINFAFDHRLIRH